VCGVACSASTMCRRPAASTSRHGAPRWRGHRVPSGALREPCPTRPCSTRSRCGAWRPMSPAGRGSAIRHGECGGWFRRRTNVGRHRGLWARSSMRRWRPGALTTMASAPGPRRGRDIMASPTGDASTTPVHALAYWFGGCVATASMRSWPVLDRAGTRCPIAWSGTVAWRWASLTCSTGTKGAGRCSTSRPTD